MRKRNRLRMRTQPQFLVGPSISRFSNSDFDSERSGGISTLWLEDPYRRNFSGGIVYDPYRGSWKSSLWMKMKMKKKMRMEMETDLRSTPTCQDICSGSLNWMKTWLDQDSCQRGNT